MVSRHRFNFNFPLGATPGYDGPSRTFLIMELFQHYTTRKIYRGSIILPLDRVQDKPLDRYERHQNYSYIEQGWSSFYMAVNRHEPRNCNFFLFFFSTGLFRSIPLDPLSLHPSAFMELEDRSDANAKAYLDYINRRTEPGKRFQTLFSYPSWAE